MGYSPWACKELDTTEQLTYIHLPSNNLKVSSVVKMMRSVSFHLKALSCQFHLCLSPVPFSDINIQVSVCLSPGPCLLGPGEVCKPASSHPRTSYSLFHRGICQAVFAHWAFWQLQLLMKIRSFVLDKEVRPKCRALCCCPVAAGALPGVPVVSLAVTLWQFGYMGKAFLHNHPLHIGAETPRE